MQDSILLYKFLWKCLILPFLTDKWSNVAEQGSGSCKFFIQYCWFLFKNQWRDRKYFKSHVEKHCLKFLPVGVYVFQVTEGVYLEHQSQTELKSCSVCFLRNLELGTNTDVSSFNKSWSSLSMQLRTCWRGFEKGNSLLHLEQASFKFLDPCFSTLFTFKYFCIGRT